MECERFVETERTYRLSSDVVRHGLDQSSSLSVHQSPLSQRCKHRKPEDCGNKSARPTNCGILAGIVFPNPVLHQVLERLLLVSDRTGRFVAVNVLTDGKVQALTGLRIRRMNYGSALIGLLVPRDEKSMNRAPFFLT
jgi:hypothetical protein